MMEMMEVAPGEFSTSIIYVLRFKGKHEYNEGKIDIVKKTKWKLWSWKIQFLK